MEIFSSKPGGLELAVCGMGLYLTKTMFEEFFGTLNC